MRAHVELIQQSDLCWHPAELHGGTGRVMQRNLSYDEEDGSASTKLFFETAWDRPGGYHEAYRMVRLRRTGQNGRYYFWSRNVLASTCWS